MLSQFRIPNPHYPNSPARMSDGRLFTEYRSRQEPPPSFEYKHQLQSNGAQMIQSERSMTVLAAGRTGCVDTMVPETSKRMCQWNGCVTLPAHAGGIGQGRLYLPEMPGLASSDPDTVAAATATTVLHGTFPSNPDLYMVGEIRNPPATVATSGFGSDSSVGPMYNRYSLPYGNSSG